MDDDLAVLLRGKFADSAFDLSNWNQRCAEICDLVFVRLADVEHEDVLLRIQLALQLFNRDLRDPVDDGMIADRFVSGDLQWADRAWRGYAAELVVVQQFRHCWVGAADGALRMYSQLQRAGAHN